MTQPQTVKANFTEALIERLKNVKFNFDKNDFKQTLTSLNNIFVGSMIVATVMFSVWVWKVLGIWMFVLPAGYVAMCYLGRFVREKFLFRMKELQD